MQLLSYIYSDSKMTHLCVVHLISHHYSLKTSTDRKCIIVDSWRKSWNNDIQHDLNYSQLPTSNPIKTLVPGGGLPHLHIILAGGSTKVHLFFSFFIGHENLNVEFTGSTRFTLRSRHAEHHEHLPVQGPHPSMICFKLHIILIPFVPLLELGGSLISLTKKLSNHVL